MPNGGLDERAAINVQLAAPLIDLAQQVLCHRNGHDFPDAVVLRIRRKFGVWALKRFSQFSAFRRVFDGVEIHIVLDITRCNTKSDRINNRILSRPYGVYTCRRRLFLRFLYYLCADLGDGGLVYRTRLHLSLARASGFLRLFVRSGVSGDLGQRCSNRTGQRSA